MVAKIKQRLMQFHRDDRGAMSVEMMLILFIVAIPVVIALYFFGKWVLDKFNEKSTELQNDVT
ncbi:MAG TPA: hypothetical protein VHM90_07270 [Phycisphaerae bacterium]|jgi:Flp pilus assembly pilin Flp|nr:hypothetical protein [Phycisphaerae bacterium]